MISSEDLEIPFFVMFLLLFLSIAVKLLGIEINMDAGDWIQLGSFIVAIVAVSYQLNKINKQIELQNGQLQTQNNQFEAQNKQLIMQHFSDYTKRYQEIMLRLPEEINDDDFGLSKLETEYPNDYKQIKRSLRTYFDLCFEEWALNKQDFLEEDIWKIWEGGMRTAMSRPVFYELWNEKVKIDTEFGSDFNKFFDNLVKEGVGTYKTRLLRKESIPKELNP